MLSIGLFTYSTRPRGSVVHAASLADALTRAGHEVTLYALAKRGGCFYRPLSCRVELFAAAAAPADMDALIRQRVAELVAGYQARPRRHDVLHAQDCLAASALLALRPRPEAPIVRTVHHLERYQSPYLAACQHRSIRDADALFAVSRFTQGEVQDELGRTSDLVENGVELARFAGPPARTREWLSARFGVAPGDVVVLSVGGIEPRKGSHRALAAFARTFAATERLVWIIVGGDSIWDHTEYRARFDAELAGLPGVLAARVIRTGPVDDEELTSLYQLSDVLLCPSEREGFGLCVLEAMAAGAAVIVPGRPPFTEYVDETSALFVDGGSVDSIAAALTCLVGDAGLRARLAAAARPRAAALSWERSAATHVAHYHRILRSNDA